MSMVVQDMEQQLVALGVDLGRQAQGQAQGAQGQARAGANVPLGATAPTPHVDPPVMTASVASATAADDDDGAGAGGTASAGGTAAESAGGDGGGMSDQQGHDTPSWIVYDALHR